MKRKITFVLISLFISVQIMAGYYGFDDLKDEACAGTEVRYSVYAYGNSYEPLYEWEVTF